MPAWTPPRTWEFKDLVTEELLNAELRDNLIYLKDGSLTVREEDGTPAVSGVNTLVVSNGSLTDNGSGQVTLAAGGPALDVVKWILFR